MVLAAHTSLPTPPSPPQKHRVFQFRSEKTGKPGKLRTDRLTIAVCESETPINED